MSRKDPRRRLVVPITSAQRSALRGFVMARGRRGSLADQLRRIVVAELERALELSGDPPSCVEAGGLPLQLPQNLRSQVAVLAQASGWSEVAVIQGLLHRYLERVDVQ